MEGVPTSGLDPRLRFPSILANLILTLGSFQQFPPIVALGWSSHYCPPWPPRTTRCGSYIATGHRTDSIVTITNLLSQTRSHFIDTGPQQLFGSQVDICDTFFDLEKRKIQTGHLQDPKSRRPNLRGDVRRREVTLL